MQICVFTEQNLGQIFVVFICKSAFRLRVEEEFVSYAVAFNYMKQEVCSVRLRVETFWSFQLRGLEREKSEADNE